MGVKAEIEKTPGIHDADEAGDKLNAIASAERPDEKRTSREWLEMTIEIPGQRDDEASTVFLAEMLREALLADREFAKKLWINRRFHWRLYLDVSAIVRSHTPLFLFFYLDSQKRGNDGAIFCCYAVFGLCVVTHSTDIPMNLSGSTHLSTAVLSSSSPLPDDASCPSRDSTTAPEVRRRRGPHVR